MYKIQIDIADAKRLERGVDPFLDVLVPVIVEFGGDPDLGAGDAGGSDAFANLGFVAIGNGASVAVSELVYSSSFFL